MCGLTGFFTPDGIRPETAARDLDAMRCTLHHRGPDDAGEWIDAAAGVAIGHRRLSVIDLTAGGHQPQLSHNGRFVMAFNGEIYNHLELRRQLEPCLWRSRSDTETLLVGFERWGLEETLRRATGMFAIAMWDRQEQVLSLARDRMGEKPLYYGWQGTTLLFGSELKAFRKHPAFVGELDREAIGLYVRRGFVPGPRSIYAGIHKLRPGTVVRFDRAGGKDASLPPRAFWSLRQAAVDGCHDRFQGGPDAAVGALEQLLLASVRRQQLADVALGAFLSGGVDSSTVVALMQATSTIPVNTYTIGFHERGYDEASHARAVAAHLKTNHVELYVSPEQAQSIIPGLARTYDEPFADISQIPTTLVSQLARRDVTVALSGDGGDELFAGYDRYAATQAKWNTLSRVPRLLRALAAPLLPGRVAEGIASRSQDELYQFMISQWKGTPGLVIGSQSPFVSEIAPNEIRDPIERLMFCDQVSYLPDDILAKVDRAAMSNSLETRVPMLDHEVVEFAWRLPIAIKQRNGVAKWPLKQILYKYVPKKIVDRPKMGFGVPMGHWLRGPLTEWADDLLSSDRLRRDGIFNLIPITTAWAEHRRGAFDRHYALWTILMFQAWLDSIRA